MLQQVTTTSPNIEFRPILPSNSTTNKHLPSENGQAKNEFKRVEMLNRTMYHKIKNEISILKSIVYRIMFNAQSQDRIFVNIINRIDVIFYKLTEYRQAEQSQVMQIPANDYNQLLQIITQTAQGTTNFVNNELAIIESKVRRFLYHLSETHSLYAKLMTLLERLELTQSTVNDLKWLNEGIKIRYYIFNVEELFEAWRHTPQIEHATIELDIQNGQVEFQGDEPKIRGFINELVENSLKHNPDQADLLIRIGCKDVSGLPSYVKRSTRKHSHRLLNEQKYLAITVSDNGKGIPQNKKEWIFWPLNTTSTDGSGLGLFFIQKTLEAMNGYVVETGSPGAKFELYIPYSYGGEKWRA